MYPSTPQLFSFVFAMSGNLLPSLPKRDIPFVILHTAIKLHNFMRCHRRLQQADSRNAAITQEILTRDELISSRATQKASGDGGSPYLSVRTTHDRPFRASHCRTKAKGTILPLILRLFRNTSITSLFPHRQIPTGDDYLDRFQQHKQNYL